MELWMPLEYISVVNEMLRRFVAEKFDAEEHEKELRTLDDYFRSVDGLIKFAKQLREMEKKGEVLIVIRGRESDGNEEK